MADETPDETYTDFMIRAMEGEDSVSQAVLIVRRNNGTIGYRTWNQEFADTFGLMRFAVLSMENDLKHSWDSD